MRLDALENGPDRKATRKTDNEAMARLAKAGIDSKQRARLAELVAQSESVSDAPDPNKAAAREEREAAYLTTLIALRGWYEEWSQMARVAVKRRDHLIRMGEKRALRPIGLVITKLTGQHGIEPAAPTHLLFLRFGPAEETSARARDAKEPREGASGSGAAAEGFWRSAEGYPRASEADAHASDAHVGPRVAGALFGAGASRGP